MHRQRILVKNASFKFSVSALENKTKQKQLTDYNTDFNTQKIVREQVRFHSSGGEKILPSSWLWILDMHLFPETY